MVVLQTAAKQESSKVRALCPFPFQSTLLSQLREGRHPAGIVLHKVGFGYIRRMQAAGHLVGS